MPSPHSRDSALALFATQQPDVPPARPASPTIQRARAHLLAPPQLSRSHTRVRTRSRPVCTRPPALRYARVRPPSSRPGSLARLHLASRVPGSARPCTRFSPSRAHVSVLAEPPLPCPARPQCRYTRLLARALDLGPPRLISVHHSPTDRSRPNSLAHVHDPTSAISPRTPALLRPSETPPRRDTAVLGITALPADRNDQ
ncbi:hypothetical protein FRC08_001683 [Ceratobasidium sp. 394]|nr:hypothetical protein FRC08_001683 [Ceratobasidium sp. 394]